MYQDRKVNKENNPPTSPILTYQDMSDTFQLLNQKTYMLKHMEKSHKIAIKDTITKVSNYPTT